MTTLAVIEDNEELRAEIVEELRFRGHTVHEAANGKDGFKIISQIVPDIVLSDIDMPIENGFDLMRRVRAEHEKYADISFLFVTGQTASHEVLNGLKAGADDYITKPVDYDYLATKIDAMSRKKDRLFAFWSVGNFGTQFKEIVWSGVIMMGVIVALGFFVLLILYYIKSALGIDIFKDTHFSDWFG